MHIWLGECHVHAGINGADLKARVRRGPRRRAVHPPRVRLRDERAVPRRRRRRAARRAPRSCRRAAWSTAARETTAKKVLVATETGMLHQLHQGQPARAVRAGQPGRGVQVHEDDHAGQAAALAARRHRRGRRAAATSPTGPGASVERMIAIGTAVADRRVTPTVRSRSPPGSRPPPTWKRDVDVVVLGSGAAGLAAALAVRPGAQRADRHQGHRSTPADGVGPGRAGRRARPDRLAREPRPRHARRRRRAVRRGGRARARRRGAEGDPLPDAPRRGVRPRRTTATARR